jgi:hypothetical protein
VSLQSWTLKIRKRQPETTWPWFPFLAHLFKRRCKCKENAKPRGIFKSQSLLKSIHLPDQFVDLVLAVAQVSALDKVLELPLTEAAGWAVQLEGPQEVRGLLEVGADGVNLVDQILHTDHAVLAEILLDDLVVGERQALLVDLAISTLYIGVLVFLDDTNGQ